MLRSCYAALQLIVNWLSNANVCRGKCHRQIVHHQQFLASDSYSELAAVLIFGVRVRYFIHQSKGQMKLNII